MADGIAKPAGTADASLDDTSKPSKAVDDSANGANVQEDEDDEEGEEEEEVADGQSSTTAASKKTKKKSKKKKSKKSVAAETSGPTLDSTQSAESSKRIPAHDIRSLLEQLALSQPNQKEGKAPEDYKFWNTQPVPKFKEPNLLQTTNSADGKELPEGPILPDAVCRASVKDQPEKLLDGFEWCLLDLEDPAELQELYDLLYNHYVEDPDGSFRFDYSTQFLSWALKPPGWTKEWHIGVRTKTNETGKKGKLVASITGIPITLRVRDQTVKASEINFLAIHRKLRNKRLAPVLIKEVTRKCYQIGVYQALYTAGTLLPTPVSTCRYFHRALDWEHLTKTGFMQMPAGSTELRQKHKYRLETQTSTKGFRPMLPADIPAVKALHTKYSDRFHLRQHFSEEEISHWLCSDSSKGVVYSYVVEEGGKITDLISYYLLDSTVLRSSNKDTIRVAYLFYYATETAFSPSNQSNAKDAQTALQARLSQLVHDALILAKKDGVHVFNALTLLDNPLFLAEQKFEPGDGKLHYYLFNWRTPPLNGGVDRFNQLDASKMGGVGVVML